MSHRHSIVLCCLVAVMCCFSLGGTVDAQVTGYVSSLQPYAPPWNTKPAGNHGVYCYFTAENDSVAREIKVVLIVEKTIGPNKSTIHTSEKIFFMAADAELHAERSQAVVDIPMVGFVSGPLYSVTAKLLYKNASNAWVLAEDEGYGDSSKTINPYFHP